MGKKQETNEVKHLKCCKRSSTYKPDVIRSHPFKWIHFPLFVGIWLILWIIICLTVWIKLQPYYGKEQHLLYYFISVATFVFFLIVGILLLVWKCCVPKSKSKYDKVFLNPEYGDEKEILCIHCMTFHPPGGARCPCTINDKNACSNCGKNKESFSICCQKAKNQEERILQGPTYDVTLRKQQPDSDDYSRRRRSTEAKRNSLRSVKSGNSSSSSVVVISTHEVGTKDLINRNLKLSSSNKNETKAQNINKHKEEDLKVQASKSSVQSKKPVNLKPVDVELANRHCNVDFFGEKIPLGTETTTQSEVVSTHHSKTCDPGTAETVDLRSGSIGSLESMDKKKFNQYLHLVEINTPFSPEGTVEQEEPSKSPLSPREIFFYDLIQAAEKSDSGNSPDSTHFGIYNRYEKKRPISHILVSSDVNIQDETEKPKKDLSKRHTLANIKPIEMKRDSKEKPKEDLESPRILALTESIKLHYSEADDDDDHKAIVRDDTHDTQKKTTVKILRTVKKSPTEIFTNNPVFIERKSYVYSEQVSEQDLGSPKQESVSRYFITDIRGPPKPTRQSSSTEQARRSDERPSTSKDSTTAETGVDNDDVFTN